MSLACAVKLNGRPDRRLANQVIVATPWQKWPCRCDTSPAPCAACAIQPACTNSLMNTLRSASGPAPSRGRWRQASASALASVPAHASGRRRSSAACARQYRRRLSRSQRASVVPDSELTSGR